MKKNISIIFCIFLLSLYTNAQEFEEVMKITAFDRADEMGFGFSADISGNFIIIGAPGETRDAGGNNPLTDAGAAYIFERNADGTWDQGRKITPSVRGTVHYFGYAVAIDGNHAIVSSPFAEVNESGQISSEAGYVFVFERDGWGNWTEVARLFASDFDAQDGFGMAVDLSGNYAVISAPSEDENANGGNTLSNAGSAYFFERNSSGAWFEKQKIVPTDRNVDDFFGIQVGICGNTAVFGAIYEDEDEAGGNTLVGAGSAYIFERDLSGTWNPVKKIVAPIRAADDQFGASVAVSGHTLIVGARTEDEDADENNTLSNSGSAYIFEKDGGTWSFAQKIVASDREAATIFGLLVDIDGDHIAVGTTYESEDENGDNTYPNAGAVYIFERGSTGTWEEIKKIVASDRSEQDFFAYAAVSGNYMVVGAHGEDEDASGENYRNDCGSAYIFESCEADNTFDPDNILENEGFETCVLAPWSFYCAWDQGTMATWQLVDGACLIRPTQLSSSPLLWHVQLEQNLNASQLARLEPGETYILTFDAWGETDDMDNHVFFGEFGGDFTALLDENYTINTTAATYTYEFEMTTLFPAMKLALDNGIETSWAAFDNVSLVRKDDSAVPQNDHSCAIQISPNPASESVRIAAEEGAVIKLYTVSGICIGEETVYSNPSILDISGLESNVYILEVSRGGDQSFHKLIVQ